MFNLDIGTKFSAVLTNDLSSIVEFRFNKNNFIRYINPNELIISYIGNPPYARRIELPFHESNLNDPWESPYIIGKNTINVRIRTSQNMIYEDTINYYLEL